MKKALTELKGISKNFSGVKALQNVDLTIYEGETRCLAGENGCGKSTLLKLAGGLNHPKAGKIDLLGVRPGEASGEELRLRVSYIPSESHLYTGDVRSNIGMSLDGENETAIAEACIAAELSREGGEDLAESSASELSGGQAQRAAIARAIVDGPKVLLADEPMSAIDVAARVRILESFEAIRNAEPDMAIIMVSHDLGVVQHIADRILVLHDGRVAETGATSEVLGHPQDEYTKRLVQAASL